MSAQLYEVLLTGLLQGQRWINRWNYLLPTPVSGESGAFGLFEGLGETPFGVPPVFSVGTLFEAIRGMVSDAMSFEQCQVRNVFDPTDFYGAGFVTGVVGEQVGVGLPGLLAFGLVSTRTRLDIRRGHKRFCGVTETDVVNRYQLSSAAQTHAQAVADLMSADVTYVGGVGTLVFHPCVVQKEKIVALDGKVTYAYYSAAAQFDHLSVSPVWSVQPNISTQNSRKQGRGV